MRITESSGPLTHTSREKWKSQELNRNECTEEEWLASRISDGRWRDWHQKLLSLGPLVHTWLIWGGLLLALVLWVDQGLVKLGCDLKPTTVLERSLTDKSGYRWSVIANKRDSCRLHDVGPAFYMMNSPNKFYQFDSVIDVIHQDTSQTDISKEFLQMKWWEQTLDFVKEK